MESHSPNAVEPPGSSSKDERTWAMLCHLLTLAPVPMGNIIAPLVIWLIKKDEYPLVDDQGKEALNFQISMTLYVFGAVALSLVCIGFPFLIALPIFDLIVVIIATVRAYDGERYRYPLCIRFIR